MPESLPKLQFLTGTNPDLTHAKEADQACKGGIRFVQFREKEAPAEKLRQMAKETLEVCHKYGSIMIIDDAVDVANDLGADGVHLGYNDMTPAQARQMLDTSAIIGGTGNDFGHVEKNVSQGVDYLGIGPFRHTTSKKSLKPILGLKGYQKLLAQIGNAGITTPVYAIGGIRLMDVKEILATGVYGIAVSSAIGCADNIEKAARDFVDEVDGKAMT